MMKHIIHCILLIAVLANVQMSADAKNDECSNGCIPVPEMGWDWLTLYDKIKELDNAGETDAIFCGPFHIIAGEASLRTLEIPNIRKLVCCPGDHGAPCKIELKIGRNRSAFRLKTDHFKFQGFHLLAKRDRYGYTDGFLMLIRDAKHITIQDCVFEASEESYLTVATLISGASKHILFDRCTWHNFQIGTFWFFEGVIQDVKVRHSLFLGNGDTISGSENVDLAIEGCAFFENGYAIDCRDEDDSSNCAMNTFDNKDLVWYGPITVTVQNSYLEDAIPRAENCMAIREQSIDDLIEYLMGLEDCSDGDLLRHYDYLIGKCGRIKGLKEVPGLVAPSCGWRP